MANILRLGGGGSSILTTPIQVTGLKAVGQDGGVALNIDPATEASYPYLKDYWVVWKKKADGPIQNPYDGQHMTFAAQTGPAGQDLAKLAPGSTLKILENNVPTQFLVLQHGYPDADNGKTLLLRKNAYNKREWSSSGLNEYEKSSINTFLNNEYLLLLDEKVRSQVPAISLPYILRGNGEYTPSFLDCKVFLLSYTEVGFTGSPYAKTEGAAIAYFNSNDRRIAYFENTAVDWWLRSPMTQYNNRVWFVDATSTQNSTGVNDANRYCRPAFCLPGNTKVSLEPDSQGDYTLV